MVAAAAHQLCSYTLKSSCRQYTNEHDCIPLKLHLQTLKFEFHIISRLMKYFLFFLSLKNVKTVFNL